MIDKESLEEYMRQRVAFELELAYHVKKVLRELGGPGGEGEETNPLQK